MPFRLMLVAATLLSACLPFAPQPQTPTIPDGPPDGPPPGATLHSFTIQRAYTLTDTRELAFRDQIAAEARVLCGLGDYSLYASRPVGPEEVRDDFIYRAHDIQITCDG